MASHCGPVLRLIAAQRRVAVPWVLEEAEPHRGSLGKAHVVGRAPDRDADQAGLGHLHGQSADAATRPQLPPAGDRALRKDADAGARYRRLMPGEKFPYDLLDAPVGSALKCFGLAP